MKTTNLTQLVEEFLDVNSVLNWIETSILTTEMLLQIGFVVVSLMISVIVSSRIVRPMLLKMERAVSIGWLKQPLFYQALHEVRTPAFWLLFQTIGIIVFSFIDLPAKLITITANLTAAWVAIRFFSAFVRNVIFSKFIALTVWTIAALNIVSWLDPTVKLLDSVAFSVGELNISLLTVIKGLITLGLLLWFAVSISNLAERHIRNVSSLTPSLQVLLTKLVKIALITFAILIGISSVGIDITALAVFSGAVGVGIGFGLQKIVSNFISGIILLIDRSIKPGDVIEVDDTYGWINKLSGRHVSVITRDGKEHLIPNEDLITQRVINWSYSSKRVRLHIPFGVSYKADPHKVRELALEAASKVGRLLSNPAPVCLMKEFGDNSVNFELRVWIDDPSNGVSNVISAIMFELWDAFKASNVEIPFPQRDVHLDLTDATKEALLKR